MYLFSQISRTLCTVSCWFFLAAYKGDYSLLGHLLWFHRCCNVTRLRKRPRPQAAHPLLCHPDKEPLHWGWSPRSRTGPQNRVYPPLRLPAEVEIIASTDHGIFPLPLQTHRFMVQTQKIFQPCLLSQVNYSRSQFGIREIFSLSSAKFRSEKLKNTKSLSVLPEGEKHWGCQ